MCKAEAHLRFAKMATYSGSGEMSSKLHILLATALLAVGIAPPVAADNHVNPTWQGNAIEGPDKSMSGKAPSGVFPAPRTTICLSPIR